MKGSIYKMLMKKAELEKCSVNTKNELERAARRQKVMGTKNTLYLWRLEVEEGMHLLERERSRMAALLEQEQEVGGKMGELVVEQGRAEARS